MPFKPIYTITDKILNNISQITAGREIIENAKIIPKWELRLKKEARLHNAHSSTHIEGNRLTLPQVEALAENKDITASEKDKKEVINYLKALDYVPRYSGKQLDVKLFLKLHNTITRGTLKEEKDCGVFRTREVFVGRRILSGTGIKEVVEYEPPKAKDVPDLVQYFLGWLHSEKARKINPIILAGIVHYEIARIHPFIDGNGRTARLLAALMFYKSGFDHRRFFALDDYYDENRNSYYDALKSVQKNNGDLTAWLEYFSDGVLYSINKVRETIFKLGLTAKPEEAEQLELTKRQVTILKKIRERDRVSNSDLQEMFKISRQAILKEISKLIKLGIIEIVGKGRGARYKIKD